MTGGYIFTGVCPFTFVGGGGVYTIPDRRGYPFPGVWMGVVTPSQVWMRGGGYPIPGVWMGGGTPSQVWMGGTQSQVWMEGTPSQVCGGGGDTPSQVWMGGTQSQVWMGVPHYWVPPPNQETDQQSKHLLRGGRCASCVHAGGLSCPVFDYLPMESKLSLITFSLCNWLNGMGDC